MNSGRLSSATISAALASNVGEREVAFGAAGIRTIADFRRDVARLTTRFEVPDEHRYLVSCTDAYAFAVTLAALSLAGKIGVLAPNAQPGTLAELAAETDAAIFTESGSDARGRAAIDPLECGAGAGATLTDLSRADPERPLLEMFTSGTGGTPGRIVKRLCHLESEVAVLESTFGARCGSDARVFGTPSPQHLYGLLFRVLWPLLAGRAFQRETLLRPEELIPQLAASGAAVLVGTPTHLRVLAASRLLPSASQAVRAVFSSGGPLAPETGRAIATSLGQAPIEIFGSSESGGIAHRVRDAEASAETAWQPLESVTLDIEPGDGRLVVTSPFVSVGESVDAGARRRYVTGDRAEWAGQGRFSLLGRADRVVQIAEKRVSLPEFEARMADHVFVRELCAGPFELQGTLRLGVLVVPSQAGRRALAAEGRARVRTAIAERLAPYYDPVALPRRWRFVEELPRDAQGKITMAAISRTLETKPPEEVTEPVLLGDSSREGTVERRVLVPKDLVYLDGHFARFPLVAGVVQVKWATEAACELLAGSGERPYLRSVKFKEPLRPGQEFTLHVELDAEARRIDFSLADGDRAFCSGRLALDRESAE